MSATVNFDNLKGTCKGTGRLQIRLNNGESLDQVKLNFLRKGYQIEEFITDANKKSVITGTPMRYDHEVQDHKYEKQYALATQNPDMFGTTHKYYPARA